MDQGNISRLEKRTDMYLSTLRRYVEAMGGVLEIRAVFPDGGCEDRFAQQAFRLTTICGEADARYPIA